MVPVGLGPAVHRIVFSRGSHFEILGMISLETLDERHAHAAGQERILTVGLLPATPARIAEYVDIGGPKGQSFVYPAVPLTHEFVVLCPGLVGCGNRHPVNQAGVPCRSHADRLGEYRRHAGPGDAVQALVPPVVRGDAQSLNFWCVVHHLRHFFLECHARYEIVCSLLKGTLGIEIQRRVFPGTACHDAPP